MYTSLFRFPLEREKLLLERSSLFVQCTACINVYLRMETDRFDAILFLKRPLALSIQMSSYSSVTMLRFVHTEQRQRQRQRQRNRCKCSHWGGVSSDGNGNGNSKMHAIKWVAVAIATPQCEHSPLGPIRPIPWRHLCRCRCRHKWVPNPFHDDAVAVSAPPPVWTPPLDSTQPIHEGKKIILPLPLPSFSVKEPLVILCWRKGIIFMNIWHYMG